MTGRIPLRRPRAADAGRKVTVPTLLVCGLLALGIVALSGCGATTSVGGARQQAFLDQVHQNAPDVGSYRSDVALSRLGSAVCDDFRSGAGYQAVADRLGTTPGANRLPSSDLGAVITAAASVYCPEYASRLR